MDFSLKARVARMRAVEAKHLPVVHRHGVPTYRTNVRRNKVKVNGYPMFEEVLAIIGGALAIWLFLFVVMSV